MLRRSAALLPLLALAALPVSAGGGRAAAGPWDLRDLQKKPLFEMGGAEEVREGDARVVLSRVHYVNEPFAGKPARVFAYYARPVEFSGGRLPAIVLVHGGGGKAFPEWARQWAARGYAALAMDLSGRGENGERLPDGGPEQSHEWKFDRIREGVRSAWSYHAVAAVLRGVGVLRAQREVDGGRIGITGISWGGYLTCIAMSLDNRIKVAVPVYGCGFLQDNSAWSALLKGMAAEHRTAWIENFDPSVYLPRCKIPVLWVNGTNDRAYPLDIYRKSYLAMPGPRTLCVRVGMPHSHQAGWAPQEIHLFVDRILRPQEVPQGLATVGLPRVDGNRLRLAYSSESAMERAEVHWTTQFDRPWQEREWTSARARVAGLDEVEAELPAERPLAYFLTLTDRRGAVTSTPHQELGK